MLIFDEVNTTFNKYLPRPVGPGDSLLSTTLKENSWWFMIIWSVPLMSVRHRIRCCTVVTNLSASLARWSFLRFWFCIVWFCVWVEMMLSCCLIFGLQSLFCSVHVQWAGEMDLICHHVLIVGVNPAGYCKDWETSVQWSSHLRCTGFPLPPKELSLYITFTLNYNIKHMQSFGHEAFNNAGQISHNTNQVKMYLT